jgi:hypothetical protein
MKAPPFPPSYAPVTPTAAPHSGLPAALLVQQQQLATAQMALQAQVQQQQLMGLTGKLALHQTVPVTPTSGPPANMYQRHGWGL